MADGNYKEIFEHALAEIGEAYKAQGKESDFNLWFNLKYVSDLANTITIEVQSQFLITQIKTRGYAAEITEKIRDITGQQVELGYVVRQPQKALGLEKKEENLLFSAEENYSEKAAKNKKDEPQPQPKKHAQLRENFTFETFVPGDNNTYAYNAALAIAKEPGKEQRYNPLLLYGGSGLGKTHLMQSVGNFVNDNAEKQLKICYITAEDFTNEFTSSLLSKTTDKFKAKYRGLDLLLIDDIHFLQKKTGVQEELFYTFEALIQKKGQMIFTCDRPIKELKEFNDRMQNRLSSGICVDMNPPSYETRVAILKKKLELQGKYVPDEAVDFIAKNVESNVRDLESALNRIIGYAEMTRKIVTLEVAKEQLRDILNSPVDENISIETIQTVVAEFYNISLGELKSKTRAKKINIPRQIAIYVCRKMTENSYTEIGLEFGGRDHSTIMHAYDNIENQLKTDSTLATKIQAITHEIKNHKKN